MGKKVVIVLLVVPLFLNWHWFDPAARKNQAGIGAYEAEKYDEALKDFLAARGIKPELDSLKNNTASSLYQMKKYREALEEFSRIDPQKANVTPGGFHYNLGNTFFRLDELDKALENYKQSLLHDPNDLFTKKNYEFTLKKMEEKKQQQDQQQNQDQQDRQQQQQDKQKKHENVMQYLDQNEKKQMKDKQRAIAVAKKEKDWRP